MTYVERLMCQWHVSENPEPMAKDCPTDNVVMADSDKQNAVIICAQFLS